MRDAKNSEMKKMLAGTIALLVVVASVGVYRNGFPKRQSLMKTILVNVTIRKSRKSTLQQMT